MKTNKLWLTILSYIGLTIFAFSLIESYISKTNTLLHISSVIFYYLVTVSIIFFINKNDISDSFNDFKINWKKNIKKNILIWIIAFIFMMFFNFIINFVLSNNIAVNEQGVRDNYNNSFIFTAITTVLLAPILEEFVFRLGFREIKNKYLYLFISSTVFASLHAIGSFNSLASLIYLLPYMSLGVCFGLVFYRNQNVFDSIIIHSLHNFVIMILYLILL